MNDQVREVKEKTDIVTLIGAHVNLKKAGRHWKGLCPFHNEKSPSFIVSPEIQMYKCFGCQKSGDAFTFLEEFEGLEFRDALKVLAEKAGVTLVAQQGEKSGVKDLLYEANDLAAKFYHYLLTSHPSGAPAFNYFEKVRGLTPETIKTFCLGAAPENPQSLFTFLTKKKHIKPEVLVDAGLVYKTDRGQYVDRFRGRAIFPIQNARGATIALAGRILPGPLEKKLAKYINSPETAIYYKSESLFGLPQARAEIKKSGVVIVTEGELDMIASYQAGIKNTVAIKGSALTDAHARILSRLAKVVILALDADFAGGSAAMRGIAEAQKYGLEVRVAHLGKYKDPDEFARADAKGYKDALLGAVNIWDFVIELLFSRHSIDTAQGKLELSRELVPYLTQIEDPILQAHYVRLVAGRLSVPEAAVLSSMKGQAIQKAAPVVTQSKVVVVESEKHDMSRRAMIEERVLLLAALHNSFVTELETSLFQSKKTERIYQHLMEYVSGTKQPTFQGFVAALPPELAGGFVDTFLAEEEEGQLAPEFKQLLTNLKEMNLKSEIQRLSTQIQSLDTRSKEAEISELQQKIGELTKALALLHKDDYTSA